MKQQELIKQMTDKELLINLYGTQFLMLASALILSRFLFTDKSEFLALFVWDPVQIFVIGGGVALLVILFQLLLEKKLPKDYLDDGGINKRVFENRSYMHIFVLTLVIAFCEELLFRGVLQTHFGIVPASIIFAVIHLRYWSKIVLFTIVVCLSFLLGLLFYWTNNLLVSIFAHFVIDFGLGCILRFRNKKNNV